MTQGEQAIRPGRLQRIADFFVGDRHAMPSGSKREPTQWWSGVLTKEQAADWDRRQKVHRALAQIAFNDPSLGMEIFDQLRASDDTGRRYTAASMVTSLFHASELVENKAVLSLLQDPDADVRIPLDLLFRTINNGTDLDIHEQNVQS